MVSEKRTNFGLAADRILRDREMRVSDLAATMGISSSHAYNVMRGTRMAGPEIVSAMATTLNATPQERLELNIAAAKDMGFSIDLPEDW